EAFGPGSLAGRIPDQVLAHLDQRVNEPPTSGVLPQAIALQLTRVGLIVADDEIALRVEAFEQRAGQPQVPVPQHADVPRPWALLPAFGERMDRQQAGGDAAGQSSE